MAVLEEEGAEAEEDVVVADLDLLSVGEVVVVVDLDDDIVCRVVLVMEIYVGVYERWRKVRSVGESCESLGGVIDFSRFI